MPENLSATRVLVGAIGALAVVSVAAKVMRRYRDPTPAEVSVATINVETAATPTSASTPAECSTATSPSTTPRSSLRNPSKKKDPKRHVGFAREPDDTPTSTQHHAIHHTHGVVYNAVTSVVASETKFNARRVEELCRQHKDDPAAFRTYDGMRTVYHALADGDATLVSADTFAALARTLAPYVDVNSADLKDGGVTALHVVAANSRPGSEAVAEALLSVPSVEPEKRTATMWTPLHVAAAAGNKDVAAVFVQSGASPAAVNDHKSTPLHLALAAQRASLVLDVLLKSDQGCSADVINAADSVKATPLHMCALGGCAMLDVVLRLIELGANVDAQDKDGRTPLHWCIQRGHGRLSVALMHRGKARRDIGDTQHGVTALHLAAAADDEGLLEHMLNDDRLNVDVLDKSGRTPLMVAAMRGAEKSVAALLKRGATLDVSGTRESALLWAIHKRHRAMARSLIAAGAKLDVVDGHGNTALALACNQPARTFTSVVEDIVERAPQLVNVADARGRTPLHWAAAHGDASVLMTLLDEDVGAKITTRSSAADGGATALHWACGQGRFDAVESLVIQGENEGVDDWVNVPDDAGRTPLHWAAKALTVPHTVDGAEQCCRYLVSHGADPDRADGEGVSARALVVGCLGDEAAASDLLKPKPTSPW